MTQAGGRCNKSQGERMDSGRAVLVVLGQALGAAVTRHPDHDKADPVPRLRLRLLGISDLHAHLRGYDYGTGHDTPGIGLARLATLVRQARAEVANCLLFDNGDTIQGTALGDWAVAAGARSGPHPVIAALNHIGVDAATLGNHDFNFGLPALRHSYRGAAFPVVCANAVTRRGPSPAEDGTLFPPWALLTRRLTDEAGHPVTLRIGVIGLLPPQILAWDYPHLKGAVSVRGIVEAAAAHVPALRRAGADLVVALCHSGLGDDTADPDLEQAATALARIDGIDAVLSGHAHGRFPGPGWPRTEGIDPEAGLVHGKPLVMPGAWGSHLGQIDLALRRGPDGWQVTGHSAGLRAVVNGHGRPVPEDPELLAVTEPAHRATIAFMSRPVGQIRQRIHTYFSMVEPDAGQAAIAAAQMAEIRRLAAGTPQEGLPVLAAVSPFKCGGPAGPGHFTDIPPGPLLLRHVNDLYYYPNTLRAVAVTGAELCDWLERAASSFRRILPGAGPQPLLDPAAPSYDFDTVFGASYRIDLAAPARFSPEGARIDPAASRIRDLTVAGRPVTAGDRFVVATQNYRLGGGGQFPGLTAGREILGVNVDMRQLLGAFLAGGGTWPADRPWRFDPVPGASAVFPTSPEARSAPEDVRRLGLVDLGDREDGFALYEAPLGPDSPLTNC